MNKINLIPIFNTFVGIHHILLTIPVTYILHIISAEKELLFLLYILSLAIVIISYQISIIARHYLGFNTIVTFKDEIISNEPINNLIFKLHLADYNNHKLETDSQDLLATTALIGLLYYPVLVVYIINKGILKTSEFIKTFTKLNK